MLTRQMGPVFYARIVLRLPSGSLCSLDSRPSDALALALQLQAPLYVANSVAQVSAARTASSGAIAAAMWSINMHCPSVQTCIMHGLAELCQAGETRLVSRVTRKWSSNPLLSQTVQCRTVSHACMHNRHAHSAACASVLLVLTEASLPCMQEAQRLPLPQLGPGPGPDVVPGLPAVPYELLNPQLLPQA